MNQIDLPFGYIATYEPENKEKQQHPPEPANQGLEWGTDTNFCHHGYSPPLGSWTEERTIRNMMQIASYGGGFDIDHRILQSVMSNKYQDEDKDKDTSEGRYKRRCIQRPGQKICHCQMEKKRRDVVREGFDELGKLVPGMKKGVHTRRHMLDKAAKFIEDLIDGNNRLRWQLKELV
ncbi:hypothetical protein AWENTII_006438 [Aspergillus wentii]